MSTDSYAIISRLRGPVYPVVPAFQVNGLLDLHATSRYVDALIQRGAGAFTVTAGTSRLNLLTFEEIASLNACVAEACDGRALCIAGNPATGSTEMSLELLHAAQSAGADAFLGVYSERYYGDAAVFDYFSALAQSSNIGLMIHAIPMRLASSGPTGVQTFTIDLIEKLISLPNIIGMKEENGNEVLRQKIVQRFDEQVAIVLAGGAMRNYLANWPFKATAYLTGIGNFLPEIEQNFYSLLKRGDIESARSIVFEKELPFFNVAVNIGWHTALKATLSLFDMMPPYERPPLPQPKQHEVDQLRSICHELDWI